MKSRWTLHVHLEPENTLRSSTPQRNNPTPGENSPLAPKAGIHLPFSRYSRGPTLTRLCRHGKGHTMPSSPSSRHCRRPSSKGPGGRTGRRGTRYTISRTCRTSRDRAPRWQRQSMPRNASIVVPKCDNDITYLAYAPSEPSIPTKAVLASLGHSFHLR
jgi:hypothetical protein